MRLLTGIINDNVTNNPLIIGYSRHFIRRGAHYGLYLEGYVRDGSVTTFPCSGTFLSVRVIIASVRLSL